MSNKKILEKLLKEKLPTIIQRIKDGDSSAKEEFSVLLLPYIKLLILKFIPSLDITEDPGSLAGLIICKIINKIEKIDMNASFLGYICTLVNNQCIDEIRKKNAGHRPKTIRLADDIWNKILPYQQESSIDFYINDLFNKEDANIISLYYLHSKSFEEISTITGQPVEQIKETIEQSLRIYEDS